MDKISSYIGFAIKSNSVVKGLDDILKSKKRIEVIIVSFTIKENSYEKLQNFAIQKNIKVIKIDQSVFDALNISGVKILGVTDKNLASAIIKIYN